ncbi:G-rich sequence factor 1 [Varanus komodoensis]|nr:G-rich sequence factor 1 [Varanus komodoensis]
MKSLQSSSASVTNDGVVRLRGLPYSCTEAEISKFFSGLTIVGITFVMDQMGIRKTGEAFVQFATPEMATQALLKDKEEIGSRYIEIFPSQKSKIRTHNGFFGGKKMMGYPTMKQEPEPVFEESELSEALRPAAAYESDKENEVLKQAFETHRDVSEAGSFSSFHFVHLKGLPYHATAQNIINFFAPLKPVRITMEYNSSGKATGEADVHFETHEDAVAAMAKNRSNMR